MTSADATMAEARDIIEANSDVVALTDDLSRDDWLRLRKEGIGGSDAAGSIGLSPWVTPFSLWVDKTTDAVSDEDNDLLKWGRRLERPIMEGFSEDTGIPVLPYPRMLRSKKWPWMVVNLDGIAPLSVVEVKNVGHYMAQEWEDGAVPAHYGVQGQHACAVTGLPGVHFAPLVGGNDLRPVYVARNDDLIEKLVEGEKAFWDLVKANTPPDMDDSKVTTRALKAMFNDPEAESKVELPGEALQLLQRRADYKQLIKDDEAEITAIENQLFSWMGNAEIGLVNGVTVFTWKMTHYKGYTVDPRSNRRIHVPKPKKGK